MKKKETTTVQAERIVSVTCDVCGKTSSAHPSSPDFFEAQEFHFIKFTGGYGSVFGDMTEVECDICQHCLYEMIKDYYRTTFEVFPA